MSISERDGAIGLIKSNGEEETFQQKANFSLLIVAKVKMAMLVGLQEL